MLNASQIPDLHALLAQDREDERRAIRLIAAIVGIIVLVGALVLGVMFSIIA
jgi:hypothetical protein